MSASNQTENNNCVMCLKKGITKKGKVIASIATGHKGYLCYDCFGGGWEYDTDEEDLAKNTKMITNLKVQGNHIQHILDKILGLHINGLFTGTLAKQNEFKQFQLSDGAITTEGNEIIKIHYYWDYRITVKHNLLTFPIVDRNTTNHVMKVLTDAQQEDILAYLSS